MTFVVTLNEFSKKIFLYIMCFNLQKIVYSSNTPIDGIAEIQEVSTVLAPFQIGFKGVYTG
jgi:hypothetical protein